MGTHSQVGSHRVNQGNKFFAEHGYLQVPSLVQWMSTLKCGLCCEHCLAVSRDSGFSDMPMEKVKMLIDEIIEMGVKEFLITGGEPLAREDLAEVIDYLGSKKMNWTLNTSAMPEKNLRRVIAQNRPGFVAVSLDGPRQVHDEFRGKVGAWDEAMEAIRFFKSLEGVRVCAGTTVTSRNYDHLDETFHLVAASGANQWGIHLLVPEGRAAERADLFLSRKQLKRLIKFVARKRQYFRVEMADEIGYLGYLEPLVRDVPLTCGAGRSQCVILPDGEIVPCTTLDRSCSAGNIYDRSLRDIWANGFQELRAWRPNGKCARCDYSAACKGGCWLQRKAGTQCFKDVWHVPGAMKTAAGIAICLGGMAVYQNNGVLHAAVPTEKATQNSTFLDQSTDRRPVNIVEPLNLDVAIMRFYAELAAGSEIGNLTPLSEEADCNNVACQFFTSFQQGTLPQDMVERCTMVCNALETEQRSLSLAALCWRVVSEPLFDPNTAIVYSESDRQVIRDTLAAIKQKAHVWRLEIFVMNLDPYLSNGRWTEPPRFMYSKAGPRPGDIERYALSKDLNEERWGVGDDPDTRKAAEAYLLEHRYADQMDIVFSFSGTGALVKYTGDDVVYVSSDDDQSSADPHKISIFDVIETSEDVTLSFEIISSLKVDSRYDYGEENLLADQGREEDLSTTITVLIEAGREYTYVELLNAIYQQKKDSLASIAEGWLVSNSISVWDEDVHVVAAVHQNGALLWPAFREFIETGLIVTPGGRRSFSIETPLSDDAIRRAVLKDIDFWMF